MARIKPEVLREALAAYGTDLVRIDKIHYRLTYNGHEIDIRISPKEGLGHRQLPQIMRYLRQYNPEFAARSKLNEKYLTGYLRDPKAAKAMQRRQLKKGPAEKPEEENLPLEDRVSIETVLIFGSLLSGLVLVTTSVSGPTGAAVAVGSGSGVNSATFLGVLAILFSIFITFRERRWLGKKKKR